MDPKTLYYVMSVLGPYLESQPYVSYKNTFLREYLFLGYINTR